LAFTGTFDHNLDAKNRLTIPSKFRAALAGGVYLVRGVEKCVSLYPAQTYEQIAQETLRGINPLSTQGRELRRVLYASALETELDSAGRVMLGPKFLEHASIDREVVITGVGECLELWDRSAWEAYDNDLTARAPDLTESLGHPA
jgi:MraZ protein